MRFAAIEIVALLSSVISVLTVIALFYFTMSAT
jgi:hypothetical protein